MYFEKNRQALLRAEPAHQALMAHLDAVSALGDDEYEFFQTDDGHFTLKYRGVFLHDPAGPLDEAQAAFDTHCTPVFDHVHLLLGLGLGYAVERTLRASPGKILVYEPHLSLLRFVLENVDLSHHFESGRVWIAATPHDLQGMLSRRIYGDHQLDVLALRGYAYLLRDEIPGLMDRILELTGNWIQDYRTGEFFHFKWMEQFFANYAQFASIPTTDALVERFRDKPALVISRGPSLDADLDAVRELAGSAVLIAVGGAIRALWGAGIVPDFALFYDANGMAEQLHGIPPEVLSKITFLMSPFTQQCCFETPSHGKMIFLGENNAPFARVLDAALGQAHHRVEGGGTVSLIAYQMAQAMGCNPILLLGQDLAFPGNRVYAGGIALQVDEQGRMALEKSADLYAEPETMAIVAGQNGEELPTLKCYLSYIRHFEELAVKNAAQERPAALYNCSLGGARIEGFALRSLSDFVGELPAWKKTPLLPDAPGFPEPEASHRRGMLRRALALLKDDIGQALRICEAFPPAPVSGGALSAQDYRICRETLAEFYRFGREHPFLEYAVLFEMLQYKRRFKEAGGWPDVGAPPSRAALEAMRTLMENSERIWRDRLLSWINQAGKADQHLNDAETQATLHVF
jgi:hypothetical protein